MGEQACIKALCVTPAGSAPDEIGIDVAPGKATLAVTTNCATKPGATGKSSGLTALTPATVITSALVERPDKRAEIVSELPVSAPQVVISSPRLRIPSYEKRRSDPRTNGTAMPHTSSPYCGLVADVLDRG